MCILQVTLIQAAYWLSWLSRVSARTSLSPVTLHRGGGGGGGGGDDRHMTGSTERSGTALSSDLCTFSPLAPGAPGVPSVPGIPWRGEREEEEEEEEKGGGGEEEGRRKGGESR